jgi:transcriptional regulator with XRE-family HTH domain
MRVGVAPRAVHNRLAAVLARLDVPLGELARRTMLPPRVLARLRSPQANPPLRVAARIARALGVRVEAIFSLAEGTARACGPEPTRTGLGPLLADRRLSDVQLACAAGLDRAHVNRLKNGRTRPSVATALAIAGALGVQVAAVFPPCDPRRARSAPRRRRAASVAVGGTGVGGAAIGAALIAQHQRPAEVDRER